MCNSENTYDFTRDKRKQARIRYRKLMELEENQQITEDMLDDYAIDFVAVYVNSSSSTVRKWLLEQADDSEPQEIETSMYNDVNKKYAPSDVIKFLAKDESEMTHYITVDNDDGTTGIIYKLKCSQQEALGVFIFTVELQSLTRKSSQPTPSWHKLCLFDSAGTKIAQES